MYCVMRASVPSVYRRYNLLASQDIHIMSVGSLPLAMHSPKDGRKKDGRME